VLNHFINFGWEYVWHCHILSHEEMDMMHSLPFVVKPNAAPSNVTATSVGNGNNQQVNLTWVDNSINETNFTVQRSISLNGPWLSLTPWQRVGQEPVRR